MEYKLHDDYKGLYGEVVTCDIYRLRQVPFVPDIVFDVGANVGFFSRFAHELWPKAKIIAVEPDPENCKAFRALTNSPNITLLQKALGTGGLVYHGLTARNGSGQTYLSPGLGYPDDLMRLDKNLELSTVESITFFELYAEYFQPQTKCLVKIDCEGAENSIWQDEGSFIALQDADYVAMELHDYGLTHESRETVLEVTAAAMQRWSESHVLKREGVNFWALHKKYEHKVS